MNTVKPAVSASLQSFPDDIQGKLLRVLLLEDDPAYRHLCERYLKRDPGSAYEIVSVASANEGVQACLNQTFDCLLVDYCLPDATGVEILELLAERMGASLPPAIVMSAMGGQSAAAESVRAGAVDFLQKGVVTSEC